MVIFTIVDSYRDQFRNELELWQAKMQRHPSIANRLTRSVQTRINKVIPEKIHQAVTVAIKQMIRGVIFGADFTTPKKEQKLSLEQIETNIRKRIKFYRSTAAMEGAVTGAGGFLLGLADFPLWLSLKMKMLYEIAAYYGMDVKDYRERIYILYIFQITFSSQLHRNEVYRILADWETQSGLLPNDIHQFDWRTFQLEYRDHIDLAKMLQLIPGVGAVVGAYVNHRLTDKLGTYAMNAYRMRTMPNRHPSTLI